MRPSILALFLSAAAHAHASDLAARDPMEGYTIVPASFEIEVAPGQVETLTGTVQEVVAKAKAINPNFVLPPAAESPGSSDAPLSRVKRALLDRRGEVKFCWNSDAFWWAEVPHIYSGLQYLRSLHKGKVTLGAGPRVCSRVSCSYNTAIMLCNDNNHALTLNGGWDSVANSAQTIMNVCGIWRDNNDNRWTSGQNFEDSKWNTILTGKGQKC
ncbi:hypothetical protein QBC39DRAFT_73368 [Podospora conica]|nr:hypothetical protein QBC39DRAFT_73368 [Schizothecium conicum]